MRDGTVLRADVYRPGGSGPWPVLLSRLPYGSRWPWRSPRPSPRWTPSRLCTASPCGGRRTRGARTTTGATEG
ncbi:CocE/NonD family hydrolase [Streptomyces sp. SP17KL33]|uniref:CocE/NonD family hydrolase n=1 Tax=Streptomyces sp. SP17KL33 TaxID=3002534 RepID=UPI002E797292|nr:CocE/NonD family hydrolase [Streptomyces sp. SP17KL33]